MFSGRGSGWSCWHSKAGMGVEACRQRWSDSVDGTTVWATLRSRGAGPSGSRRRSTAGPERECGPREENAVKRPHRRRKSRRPLPREGSPRSKTGAIMRRDPKRFVGPDGKTAESRPSGRSVRRRGFGEGAWGRRGLRKNFRARESPERPWRRPFVPGSGNRSPERGAKCPARRSGSRRGGIREPVRSRSRRGGRRGRGNWTREGQLQRRRPRAPLAGEVSG